MSDWGLLLSLFVCFPWPVFAFRDSPWHVTYEGGRAEAHAGMHVYLRFTSSEKELMWHVLHAWMFTRLYDE